MKIRHEIHVFSEYMEHKLALNDHKGGWELTPLPILLDKLRAEVEELAEAVEDGTNLEKMLEAADVANFAMMIAWNSILEQHRHLVFGSKKDGKAEDAQTLEMPF